MQNRRSKAKIPNKFRAQNKLAENDEAAKHNENCYRKYHQKEIQRHNTHLEIFG